MSTLVEDAPELLVEPEAPPEAHRGDTLAASVLILLFMTFAQRVIGFGRGMLFCRWLDPEQLGQWDIAFGFLTLAAPLVVLGLPGSYGRYVEYFRQRGQLYVFLRRTTLVTASCCVLATVGMILGRNWVSRLVFNSTEEAGLVVWLAVCTAALVLNNSLVALFVALRRYKIVTVIQFVQSLGFAVFSLGLLIVAPRGSTSVVMGFGAATLLAGLGSVYWLKRVAAEEVRGPRSAPLGAFWSRLVPFAAWIWVTNMLANLFDLIDRYMIVHHGGLAPVEALRQIGNYHSSRILPVLFVSVAEMLAAMLTPHVSADWECGHHGAVVRRMNLTLKMLTGSLLAASVAVLFVAPWLFMIGFQNKFEGGLAVLPLTLAYCAWFGTIGVAQNYLWCAERAGLATLPLVVGLVVNIALNLCWLPSYHLAGAVWATTIANLVTLLLMFEFSRWYGMRIDPGTWALSLAPASLYFGPWVALGTLIVLVGIALTSDWLITPEEKRQLWDGWASGTDRLRTLRHRLAAAR